MRDDVHLRMTPAGRFSAAEIAALEEQGMLPEAPVPLVPSPFGDGMPGDGLRSVSAMWIEPDPLPAFRAGAAVHDATDLEVSG